MPRTLQRPGLPRLSLRLFPIVLALVLAALPASAQTVVDGDTIKQAGTTYRLWGIDAPETSQACPAGWAAGSEAARFLRALIEGHDIVCEPRTTDRYGRTVALCRADGADLGAAMVSAGMAWAFVRYSRDYVAQEQSAVSQGLGVHLHRCEKAWEYRARRIR